MKNELTERQRDIFTYIQQFRDENGYPPTLREIGSKFGISSTFGVKRHIDALVKKGFLTVESNASRGIQITSDHDTYPVTNTIQTSVPDSRDFQKIPIVGRVAAGKPITAVENIEDSIVIDPGFFKHADKCFGLRVKGDSMINAGIFEQDLVIVAPDQKFYNHDIVVALIDDEATVKRFFRKDDKTLLLPENDNYEAIDVSGDHSLRIVGKVVGVVRWFN